MHTFILFFRHIKRNLDRRQLRLIAVQPGFIDINFILLGCRINLGNQITLFNFLTDLNVQMFNFTGNLRTYGNQINGAHLAGRINHLLHVAPVNIFGDIRYIVTAVLVKPNGNTSADNKQNINQNPFFTAHKTHKILHGETPAKMVVP